MTADPIATFYRRPLPEGLIAFASPEGRQIFREALAAGGMECWFALAEQFHTQADPAFCGLGTLVVALNALEIDPGRVWKGPWRWYGEELLDCCLPLEHVQKKGVTLDELACLARCNGASARTLRADQGSVDHLRHDVIEVAAAQRGPVLVAGYSRAGLGQTGGGHFSPVGGYHAARDLVLVLDVARFKYPPHWVPLPRLWQAMTDVDPATGRARGWIVLDRGRLRTTTLLFRLSAGDGLGALVATLLDEAPAQLAAATGATAEELLASWVARVEVGLADRICRGFEIASGGSSRLPPEYQAAVATLHQQLHATQVFRAIALRGSLAAGQPARIPDDLLAVLLLAFPDEVMTRLPPATRAALEPLRAPGHLGAALADEVAALRTQLQTLRQWNATT
jgi:glutathione gamma-glutamylcysteinyltransferase